MTFHKRIKKIRKTNPWRSKIICFLLLFFFWYEVGKPLIISSFFFIFGMNWDWILTFPVHPKKKVVWTGKVKTHSQFIFKMKKSGMKWTRRLYMVYHARNFYVSFFGVYNTYNCKISCMLIFLDTSLALTCVDFQSKTKLIVWFFCCCLHLLKQLSNANLRATYS